MKINTSEHNLLKLKIQALTDMGLTIEGISKSVGIKATNIYKWVRGERNLNDETADKLEEWLQEFAAKVSELITIETKNLDKKE